MRRRGGESIPPFINVLPSPRSSHETLFKHSPPPLAYSLPSFIFINYISFHQHNGGTPIISIFFNNIMERSLSDIFPPLFFNNIMEVTFIFSPRFFHYLTTKNKLTTLVSMRYIFMRFSRFIANLLLLHAHNGEPRYW
jgi:hypothetical protein